MNFADLHPFVVILHMLFGFARAFFPSWFPRVHPGDNVPRDISSELAGLRGDMQDVEQEIETIVLLYKQSQSEVLLKLW